LPPVRAQAKINMVLSASADGVPVMSVRDAMYDVMFDPDNSYGVNRSAILVDIVHVGDYGRNRVRCLPGLGPEASVH